MTKKEKKLVFEALCVYYDHLREHYEDDNKILMNQIGELIAKILKQTLKR